MLRQWCQLYQDVLLSEYDFVSGGQNLDMTEKFGSHLLSTTMDRMNWWVKKKVTLFIYCTNEGTQISVLTNFITKPWYVTSCTCF